MDVQRAMLHGYYGPFQPVCAIFSLLLQEVIFIYLKTKGFSSQRV